MNTPTAEEWTAKLASHGWYIEFDAMNGACIDNELTAKAIAAAHNASISAEREKVKELEEQLGVAKETYKSARRSSDRGWQRADDYKQQLAAAVEALQGWQNYYPNMREAIDMLLAKLKEGK